MSEALREAMSSASSELGGKTTESADAGSKASESRSAERASEASTSEGKSKWSAPKWTEQWKKESLGALSKLSELDAEGTYLSPVLEEVQNRYYNNTQIQKQLQDYQKRFDPYSDVLSNLEQRFSLQGIPASAGIQQMAAVSDFLARDPDQALMWLASQFKPRDVKALVQGLAKNFQVDLSGIASEQPWVDPAMRQMLEQTVTPLQQQNQQLLGMVQNFYAGQYQQAQYAVANHLKAFQEAKDDQGNPKYPHYAELEPIMTAIVRNSGPIYDIRQLDLPALYEQAMWNHPGLREKLITEKARQAEAQAIKDAQEKNAVAEEAQRASRNVNGSGNAPKTKPRGGDLRDIMKEEARRIANR